MKAIAIHYAGGTSLQALIDKVETLISAVRSAAESAASSASQALTAANAARAAAQYHGTCSTAAATAAKAVTITGFTRATGSRVAVKFTYANTASSPTLNVENTGAAAIFIGGAAAVSGCWSANEVCIFEFDGTNWNLIKSVPVTLGNISGTLAITKGGTGATSAEAARTALGITPANIGAAAASHSHALTDCSGTLSIAKGGTGATSAAAARTALGITPANIGAAASSHSHALTSCTGTLSIAKGGTGATNAAAALSALGGAKMVRYTCTCNTSSWTANSSGGYKKTITVSGVLSTDVPVVGVVMSDDVAAAKNQATAFGCINRITTAANSITCYAFNSAPTTSITLQLLVVRAA